MARFGFDPIKRILSQKLRLKAMLFLSISPKPAAMRVLAKLKG